MKVLFAVASWGLGHATRDLGLIRALQRADHEVTVLSSERAMELLRGELRDSCDFLDVPDIPKTLGRQAWQFYVKMSLALPVFFWTFWREHQVTRRLCRTRGFDRIVSDSRYGVFNREIPSFYIVHTLRQIVPGRPRSLEAIVERIQQYLLRGARKVLVPDQLEQGLAGDLCHNLACFAPDQLEYIGILSSVRRRPTVPDIDFFITVSGAEPQRSIFEQIVLEQAHELDGRVVIALGKPEIPLSVCDDGRVAIHSFMDRGQQEEMMNRARLVISRSGYTTLMELAEVGKRALLVPTVGQSEQEYLGAYHESIGTMHTVVQSRLKLARDARIAQAYSGIHLSHRTEETTSRFLDLVVG